jgi:hypothetical protein
MDLHRFASASEESLTVATQRGPSVAQLIVGLFDRRTSRRHRRNRGTEDVMDAARLDQDTCADMESGDRGTESTLPR